ncbi:MAG TPA: SDR family oxidoreductase [Actinophytocola sp.]|uniref:SDR family NAD(P)-dependent oxidoreductase n=1 Tax=Actinophytocola sp. TaxID=1872138 RepID=UPI002DDD2396|nr:SDR family oxidoreductase [Actinophytocola sp.]HEV2777827.1 SDR family oxidoreductase [Actinophytocola sp.]
MSAVLVVGGTAGIGREIARHYAAAGREVLVTGRDTDRAKAVAGEIGGNTRGLGFDLARPEEIGAALADVGPVGSLVLAGIDRSQESVANYDIAAATRLVTLKLVGYTEVVHALRSRLAETGAVLLFGGQARVRPYPGSTTVSTVNAGVIGLVRTLAVELAPVRVNSIHPGIVGDSPFWRDKPAAVLEGFRSGTLTGRLATMTDIVGAAVFLLDNPSVNDVNLVVDGGWR